jgi:hypothetical protein
MERARPHRVAVVVLPGVIPLEFGTATQVFGRDPHYQLIVCAENRAAPAPRSGFVINTSSGLEGIKRAETVIVPAMTIRRHDLERRPRRRTRCTRPWRPTRLHLHRSLRPSRRGAPRRTSRDNPLAMDR